MSKTIDYYFTPQSPWVYLGHDRFVAIAKAAGAKVRVLPVDLGGVFPVSGGLPLLKRAPQRRAYRLQELRRFSEYLKLPINLAPSYFPVSTDDACRLIIAVDHHDGFEKALAVASSVFAAVWSDDLNIADHKVLSAILAKHGLDEARIEQSHTQAAQHRYEENTQAAIDAGVFGAPSYVIDGEIFWGQDRLDFVERALHKGA